MISRDKKILEAQKFQILLKGDPNFNFNVNSLEYNRPQALPETILNKFVGKNQYNILLQVEKNRNI